MAATFSFDDGRNQTLGVDGSFPNLPVESRNFSRDGLATVSGIVTLDSSYPTGGYSPTKPKFGLKVVADVVFGGAKGYALDYNTSTDKIQVFSAPNTEVAAATNLSTITVYFEAKGRQY